ncbi:serine/threonine-protein kinase [Streptomyces sp. NPDC059785]|uniref:serine/threonine-protein kinase n=1 Tax=Streptomyces sp. NPDC059785 TaxID=3346945 RepID=UPI00365CF7C2
MNPLGTGDPLRLGPYRLLGVLGEGGMGKVYVGQDGAGTVAAVKVLRPELSHDQGLAQRFVREALAAQAVTSGGVASVLGARTEGGRPWIATEFLAGLTLDQAVERYGPLDEAAVRALAASLARTLADIHATGFVHRDLKPPNTVLTSGGPRVIDFGIARPEHGLTLTTTGQIPVTPGYGAPEQVLGQRVASPADVFSLGAVLVYAATGRRAFEGAHVAAVQYEVVHGEPRTEGLSPALYALIAPCLAKDAAARPTPAQIAAAFAPSKGAEKAAAKVWRRGPVAEGIQERERAIRELTAQTVTGGPGGRGGPSRRRLLTGLAAGGVVVAAGGGTAAWWFGPGKERDRERQEDPFTFPAAVSTPAARLLSADDGDYLVDGHPKALWGPREVVGKESPAPLPVRDVVVVGTFGGGIGAFNVVDGKRRWAVPGIDMTARYLSLSDRLIAAADKEGTLRTFVASTGEAKWTADADAAALLAADADAVYVVTKDHRLRSVGRADAKIRWTARVPADFRGKLQAPAAVGGGRLVLSTTQGHVFAVSTKDGRQVWERRGQAKEIAVVPAVADATVYLNGKKLTALRLSDGKELWQAAGKDMYGDPVEWGPPRVHGDSVYAAAGTWPERHATSDGKKIWSSRDPGSQYGPVLVQGSGVWMVDDDFGGEVSTVDLDSGYSIWSFELPDAETHGLAVDGNRAFIRNDNSLYALPVF